MLCSKCGKEFKMWERIEGKLRNLSNRKFCLECSPFGSHNTLDLSTQTKNTETITYSCLCCNMLVERSKSKRNNLYCSAQCYIDHKKSLFLEKVLSGESIGKGTLRKYLLIILENKCSICSSTEWLGKPILLIVDHIDGNSNNDKFENLRLICSNCDACLPTYKNRNAGKGSPKRRRFYNGKQYGSFIDSEKKKEEKEKRLAQKQIILEQRKAASKEADGKVIGRRSKLRDKVSKEELESLINQYPLTTLGKMFGVTDNAIKKFAKRLGIELQYRLGYWAKLRAKK